MRKIYAFTLVETLITLSIFSVVAMVTVNLLVNGMRSARKIQAQVLLYSEAQALLDQVARDVERSTVDYEAYYSRLVKLESGWDTPTYGQYGQSFYDPGSGGTEYGPYAGINPYYRSECSTVSGTHPTDCPNDAPLDSQVDRITGAHPFAGIDVYSGYGSVDSASMNAFCETTDTSGSCNTLNQGVFEELILVNAAGDERTVYRLESFDSSDAEHTLSRVKLLGTDSDNDGIEDVWVCDSRYDCTGTASTPDVPNPDDLNDDEGSNQHDFVSLSPTDLDIEDFFVIISPYEDPYWAYAEAAEQIQPQITLVMRVSLSDHYSQGLLGDEPSIFVQRTISTGVYSKVSSYE